MSETIREMPEDLRPREKCLRYGTDALDDSELLAVILGSGVPGSNSIDLARKILSLSDSGLSGVPRLSSKDLLSVKGIGQARMLQLQCLFALSGRIAKSRAVKGMYFTSPEQVSAYCMEELRYEKQEILKALFLDTKGRLIREKNMTRGTVSASMVSARELMIEALQSEAVQLILVHNHPSGDPSPSEEDIEATKTVEKAGRIIGIQLTDHVIIGDLVFVSMREKGIIR